MIRLWRVSPVLWVIALAFLCFGMELGACQALGIQDTGPCLILALIVSVSLCQGHLWGIPLALILGLMADALTGWGMGLNMLCYSITAIVCGVHEFRINADALWMAPALSAGAVIVSELISFVISYISRVTVPVTPLFFFHLAVSLLLTGAASLGLHLILYRRLQPITEDYFMRRFRTYR